MKSQRFFFAGRLLAFVVIACLVAAVPSAAQSEAAIPPPTTVNTLVNFVGTNGETPFTENLVQGKDGNLYGTTLYGGVSNDGTVFKITPSGALTILHSFAGTDGENPYAGLVLGIDGNFYGTTYQGGVSGDGTVFKISAAGAFKTIYNFANTDGGFPAGALVQGLDNNFYGTTSFSTPIPTNNGTVFKITPTGTLTTLLFFVVTEGSDSLAGLALGTDGNFYGTAAGGGLLNFGSIFKITSSGTLSILHSFDESDGWEPESQLIQATDGNFYGTTLRGGVGDNNGEVFKISPAGTLTVLHNFLVTDGDLPNDGLVQATNGKLYGTTYAGGSGGVGTVFQITTSGTLTTLYNFTGISDGSYPYGGLVQHTNGALYGVTSSGGTGKLGTVFDLSAGVGRFIKLLPPAAKVGATITILGTSLTGITGVLFNGTAATFALGSNTFLTATVPSGATTGTVEVVTSGGTLKSNVKFRVIP
jgi:uncharacterized repeat protein (TIGR03803 family)